MKPKYFWIKERYNPQLGFYYHPVGNISIKEAKLMESPIYGDNRMLRYDSEDEYEGAIRKLKAEGERVC